MTGRSKVFCLIRFFLISSSKLIFLDRLNSEVKERLLITQQGHNCFHCYHLSHHRSTQELKHCLMNHIKVFAFPPSKDYGIRQKRVNKQGVGGRRKDVEEEEKEDVVDDEEIACKQRLIHCGRQL